MSEQNPNYDQIRRRITHRYNNRIAFYSHLVAFLIVNGLGWLLWLGTAAEARSGVLSVLLLLTTGGWLVGMLIHAVIYGLTEARERAIERTIQEEREWQTGNMEKPKRDPHMRLTEDGELEAVEDDDTLPYEEPRKRLTR
jgi:hypothetical protein